MQKLYGRWYFRLLMVFLVMVCGVVAYLVESIHQESLTVFMLAMLIRLLGAVPAYFAIKRRQPDLP